MKPVLRHIGLFTSSGSLVVIWLVVVYFAPPGASPWPVAGAAALACGLVSGIVVGIVRQRQAEARRARLVAAQAILHDIVVHHRTLVGLLAQLPAESRPAGEQAGREILRTVMTASDALQDIADETDRERPRHYHDYRGDRLSRL
jgi:hypothetical protein